MDIEDSTIGIPSYFFIIPSNCVPQELITFSIKNYICTMSQLEKNILDFLVALVSEFAARFDMTQDKAFNYLRDYKGLDYYFNHYNILHTFSFDDNVDGLIQVCANNGGYLR